MNALNTLNAPNAPKASKASKAAVVANAVLGKAASIIGYPVGILTLLCIIMSFTELKGIYSSGVLSVFFVFLAVSIFFIVKGYQIKHKIMRFKQYVLLISNQHLTLIVDLAGSIGKSTDFVKNDLQKMINSKFFTNAFINESTGEIIIGGLQPPPVSTPMWEQTGIPSKPRIELENFTCPGCGASGLKPKGAPCNCEYCGAYIGHTTGHYKPG